MERLDLCARPPLRASASLVNVPACARLHLRCLQLFCSLWQLWGQDAGDVPDGDERGACLFVDSFLLHLPPLRT